MKNVIAIFDVGKTNKKLLLFDEQYKVVLERSEKFAETTDEDGFPCEDLDKLRAFIIDSLSDVLCDKEYQVAAINFSGYGASFVYLDKNREVVAPLYNYLKPYDEKLLQQFYNTYGGEEQFSQTTASPVLGNLNSGMQLYRLKYEKPALFAAIRHALHLPQYLSYLVSGQLCSDLTSIGCHTNLWDFRHKEYHDWVAKEKVAEKLPPIEASDTTFAVSYKGHDMKTGVGLHDSSAALIPYLVSFKEPFILISTGTWCITLNPFNHLVLSAGELKQDCLCYLQYNGHPVKAARLFAGYEHDEQVKRIAGHFQLDPGFYKHIAYDDELVTLLQKRSSPGPVSLHQSSFRNRDLVSFDSAGQAYHQLMIDIVAQQTFSTRLVLDGRKTTRIFVDGGFCRNEIYMNLLAAAFPGMEVYATFMAQASALGAALAIHDTWNKRTIPSDIIELKYYTQGAKYKAKGSSLHSS